MAIISGNNLSQASPTSTATITLPWWNSRAGSPAGRDISRSHLVLQSSTDSRLVLRVFGLLGHGRRSFIIIVGSRRHAGRETPLAGTRFGESSSVTGPRPPDGVLDRFVEARGPMIPFLGRTSGRRAASRGFVEARGRFFCERRCARRARWSGAWRLAQRCRLDSRFGRGLPAASGQ